jgi:hypothetical protein
MHLSLHSSKLLLGLGNTGIQLYCLSKSNHLNVTEHSRAFCDFTQWRTEEGGGGGLGGSNPPPSLKFRSFDKAEPNSQFRGKYIRKNLIRIRGSLICKLSGTPD